MLMDNPQAASVDGNGYRYQTSLINVDFFADELMSGQVANPFFSERRSFSNLMQLLLIIEDLLNESGFPQAYCAPRRSWGRVAGQPEHHDGGERERGRLATFRVQILFRQNASWQGVASWLEGEREEAFRSALELIMLMRGALTGV